MLAPTRQLVAELNRRARDHRLNGHTPDAVVRLGDGNQSSVGDVIITRRDRRLRLTATDWVKNGDQWTIPRIEQKGDLKVRHNRSHLIVRLPLDYVRTSTGLGYATTIHAAQGVSADTMHGLVTGQESRQQLYTMLTRGRHANHLYMQVVGDGDPHTVIRPDTISPRTSTETLQQIVARDEAPVSASTLLRELNNPAARLFQAVQRYTDGLHVAAEQLVDLGPSQSWTKPTGTSPDSPLNRLGRACELTGLALAAETGKHPLRHMLTAATGRDLRTVGDMAAVLYWRLPEHTPTDPGPLPWLPGIPATLQAHPSGATTWQSDPNSSPTSPPSFKTTPATLTPSQLGLHREATRPPPSSAKSLCGAPQTASIPTTRDQPGEEANSKRSRPSGNNTSTGISPVPPIRQATRDSTNGRQYTPHPVAGTSTASARTRHPINVRTGQPHAAANHRRAAAKGLWLA